MRNVSKVFQQCFKEVSSKGVPRKFLDASRKIEGWFNGVLSGFQECLEEVEWVFEESFQGVSRKF